VSTWQSENAYAQPAGTNAVPSAARTATGNSGALRVYGDKINLLVDVTTVSGTTPSMTLTVEWSHDGTTWFPAATPDTLGAAITAGVKRVHTVDVKGAFARVVWTISGTTPSFTFAIHIHGLDY
jgi:hypothetical protein